MLAGQEQTFDGAAAWNAMSEETRREHTRIVQDQQVSRRQDARQIAHVHVPERTARAVQDEQARRAAGGGGLRDQLGRQVEIEIADLHDASGPRRDRCAIAGNIRF